MTANERDSAHRIRCCDRNGTEGRRCPVDDRPRRRLPARREHPQRMLDRRLPG
ncbi:hypothetical protein ACFPRL_15625 [Pseudoclavibacter helvolus]